MRSLTPCAPLMNRVELPKFLRCHLSPVPLSPSLAETKKTSAYALARAPAHCTTDATTNGMCWQSAAPYLILMFYVLAVRSPCAVPGECWLAWLLLMYSSLFRPVLSCFPPFNSSVRILSCSFRRVYLHALLVPARIERSRGRTFPPLLCGHEHYLPDLLKTGPTTIITQKTDGRTGSAQN